MAEFDSIEYRNVRVLVAALEELDDLVIKACREAFIGAKPVVPVTKEDLRTIEDSRKDYQNSNYGITDMLQYLEKTSEHRQIWQSSMLSILKLCSFAKTMGDDIPTWKFRVTQLLKAGDRAWRLVVPCTKIIVGGADTINEIIDKFGALDDALDQMCPALEVGGRELRYSDELQDTIRALIAYYKDSGTSPYKPVPTAEQIEVVKSELRRRQKVKIPATGQNEQPKELPPPPANLQPEVSPRNWNPTITAFIVIFTALSFLPGLKAIQYSKHTPGTVEDDNFWFLVQGSIMQLLGLLTLILPLMATSRPHNQPWFWMWGFIIVSACCSASAIPIYLYLPTEWSAIVAWLGSAAQAFAILQGMFINEQPSSDREKKE